MTKRLLTIDEKAGELGCSRQSLFRWRENGTGPDYIEYGGHYIRYFPEPMLEENAA